MLDSDEMTKVSIDIQPLSCRYRVVDGRLTRSRPKGTSVSNSTQRFSDHQSALIALHDLLVMDGHEYDQEATQRIIGLATVWVRGRPGFPPRSSIIRRQAEDEANRYSQVHLAFAHGFLSVLENLSLSGVERPSTVLPDWLLVAMGHLAEDRPVPRISIHDILGGTWTGSRRK